MEVCEEMKIVVIILVIVVLIVIVPFAVGWMWQWIVPDVFAGAVEQHILPATLTWVQALKLMILLSVLGLTASGSKSK
jgi:hypothetical protein